MKALLASLFSLLTLTISAQVLEGTLTDATDNTPITGANILIKGTYLGAYSNADGRFKIEGVNAEEVELTISHVSFTDTSFTTKTNGAISLSLKPTSVLADEVIVSATRADRNTPTTFTEVTAEQIAKSNLGQDIPQLLEQEPSLITTSDAGAGVGYTSLRIRGTDQTRINVSINGIPYNDPESQGVFWVNLPDLASSVENIQIQRGVGTSTNGAGAFGATINIQTTALNEDPYGAADVSYGSFNTLKTTARFGTGLIKGKASFDGRISRIASDGFVDRASSDLTSFFISSGYHGKKTLLKFNTFSGKEVTYQSWWGVAENILDTNRTYNYYNYPDQVDNYQQDHYQLLFSQQIGDKWVWNTALHYTRGKGFFEEYKGPEFNNDDGFNSRIGFADLGLENLIVGNDTITETSLIRRRWLDNHFYGLTFSAIYNHKGWNVTLGGGWNQFRNDHYGEVLWAEFANGTEPDYRFYDNDALKNDLNFYAKATKTFFQKLTVFADMQVRHVKYEVNGLENDRLPVSVDEDLLFFNPKAGLAYAINNRHRMYTSFALGSREPSRNDFIDAPAGTTPKAEIVRDLEVGYQFRSKKLAFTANYYLMHYKDQLILTGAVNDVGSAIRTNVDVSYRTGIELASAWQVIKQLRWSANFTYSMNRIPTITESLGVDFGFSGVEEISYENTTISFSPSFIGGSTITAIPVKDLEISFITKMVSRQYLDNTSNEGRSIDPYYVNNMRFSYTVRDFFFKEIVFSLMINNIFNHEWEANGYTFSSQNSETGMRDDFNYFYPQAGINILGGISLRF